MVEHQPVLGDLLHPGADGRGERAEPENAEIPVGERRSDAAKRRHALQLSLSACVFA
jgi:hypothetical protein